MDFTIIFSIIAGLLIALAQIGSYFFHGKLIVTHFIQINNREIVRNASLFVGYIVCMQCFSIFVGKSVHIFSNDIILFDSPTYIGESQNILVLVLGSMLLAFGARISNGCIIDHICYGIPNKRKRSLLALLIITISAVVSYTIKNKFAFKMRISLFENEKFGDFYNYTLSFGLFTFLVWLLISLDKLSYVKEITISILLGFLHGCGLIMSGIFSRMKVCQLLKYNAIWSMLSIYLPFLISSMTILFFMRIIKRRCIKPVLGTTFVILEKPPITRWDVIGMVCFGVGWGLTGMTPCTAILLGFLQPYALIYIPAILLGYLLSGIMLTRRIKSNIQ